jgi:hypothetical protein
MASDMPAGRLSLLALLGLLALMGLAGFDSIAPDKFGSRAQDPTVEGNVYNQRGPVEGALVRWKGQPNPAWSDALGHFRLAYSNGEPERLTAWKAGYFIAGADGKRKPLVLDLRPLPTVDCETYAWVDPWPNRTNKGNCANCHGEIYREWLGSGHAHSATNRHFLSLYDGTDWQGKPSVGWSLRDELPDGVGVCTACHAPTLPQGDAAYFNLSQARGLARQGVHCDYCHKIAEAGLGTIGLTHGRFGLHLLRPSEGQLFFGPLDDVDRGEDAYSPLYHDSRYCASCHEGTVLGAHVYGTYSEWLASPARQQGKQCQTCHMQPTGAMSNIAPRHGGIERDPRTLANHRFFAGSQLDMLRRAVTLSSRTERDGDRTCLTVKVAVENVGHRVPTGFVDRHLVLIVEPLDPNGLPLVMQDGPTLPQPAGRAIAGLAGRLYARLLKDYDGRSPVPFWRADEDQTEDSRLSPGQSDRVAFTLPERTSTVRVRLLHRRSWPQVAEAKAWPDNEILVFDESYEVR